MDRRVEIAVDALGGEDADFMLTGCIQTFGTTTFPAVKAECRIDGCGWGQTVGQMELWEFIADCREHWDEKHASAEREAAAKAVTP